MPGAPVAIQQRPPVAGAQAQTRVCPDRVQNQPKNSTVVEAIAACSGSPDAAALPLARMAASPTLAARSPTATAVTVQPTANSSRLS